jgi:hypothetical protein
MSIQMNQDNGNVQQRGGSAPWGWGTVVAVLAAVVCMVLMTFQETAMFENPFWWAGVLLLVVSAVLFFTWSGKSKKQ